MVNVNFKKELAVGGCVCDSVVMKYLVAIVSEKGNKEQGLVGP